MNNIVTVHSLERKMFWWQVNDHFALWIITRLCHKYLGIKHIDIILTKRDWSTYICVTHIACDTDSRPSDQWIMSLSTCNNLFNCKPSIITTRKFSEIFFKSTIIFYTSTGVGITCHCVAGNVNNILTITGCITTWSYAPLFIPFTSFCNSSITINRDCTCVVVSREVNHVLIKLAITIVWYGRVLFVVTFIRIIASNKSL